MCVRTSLKEVKKGGGRIRKGAGRKKDCVGL